VRLSHGLCGRRYLIDETVPRRSGFPVAESESMAFDLCVHIFRRGKTGGRYAIEMDELPEAMGVSPTDLQRALQLAVERAWLEYAGLMLALRAAGIYVAKTALDLPR
jgi:hypothetical protein